MTLGAQGISLFWASVSLSVPSEPQEVVVKFEWDAEIYLINDKLLFYWFFCSSPPKAASPPLRGSTAAEQAGASTASSFLPFHLWRGVGGNPKWSPAFFYIKPETGFSLLAVAEGWPCSVRSCTACSSQGQNVLSLSYSACFFSSVFCLPFGFFHCLFVSLFEISKRSWE